MVEAVFLGEVGVFDGDVLFQWRSTLVDEVGDIETVEGSKVAQRERWRQVQGPRIPSRPFARARTSSMPQVVRF